jgi:hypothetical protein
MVLHWLHALGCEHITTSFCDASDVTTTGEVPLVSVCAEDGVRDIATAPLAEPTGGAPQAATLMHASANETRRTNRCGIGTKETIAKYADFG